MINTSMTHHADISIYRLFHQRGLTRSHRHFSQAWLGAAPNYMALRRTRPPSLGVLIGLFQRLWREGRLLLAVRVAWTVLWLPPEARR